MNDTWAVLTGRTTPLAIDHMRERAREKNLGVILYAPMLARGVRVRNTKIRRIVYEPAYPGYLFARGDFITLCGLVDVSARVLRSGLDVVTVKPIEIDRMRLLEQRWHTDAIAGIKPAAKFNAGDRVTIHGGWLDGASAVIITHESNSALIETDATRTRIRINPGLLRQSDH